MSAQTEIDIHTEHDAADIAVCHQVNEILQKHYAGHPWLVGANHEAGTIHVELAYSTKVRRRFPYGFLLYTSSARNYVELERKVMNCGGELLERHGLGREPANIDSIFLAMQNGLNIDGALQ